MIHAAIHSAHWPTLGLAVLAFLIMVSLKRLDRRIPNVLVAVVVTTMISYFAGFERKTTVPIAQIESTAFRETVQGFNDTLAHIDETNGEQLALNAEVEQVVKAKGRQSLEAMRSNVDQAYARIHMAELNEKVRDLRRSIPVNVATDPADCDFLIPAKVRRGHFSVAISTDGCCPAFTRNLRRKLDREYDDAWGQAIELLEEARSWIQKRVASLPRRRKILNDIAQPDLVGRIRQEGLASAREALFRILSEKAHD